MSTNQQLHVVAGALLAAVSLVATMFVGVGSAQAQPSVTQPSQYGCDFDNTLAVKAFGPGSIIKRSLLSIAQPIKYDSPGTNSYDPDKSYGEQRPDFAVADASNKTMNSSGLKAIRMTQVIGNCGTDIASNHAVFMEESLYELYLPKSMTVTYNDESKPIKYPTSIYDMDGKTRHVDEVKVGGKTFEIYYGNAADLAAMKFHDSQQVTDEPFFKDKVDEETYPQIKKDTPTAYVIRTKDGSKVGKDSPLVVSFDMKVKPDAERIPSQASSTQDGVKGAFKADGQLGMTIIGLSGTPDDLSRSGNIRNPMSETGKDMYPITVDSNGNYDADGQDPLGNNVYAGKPFLREHFNTVVSSNGFYGACDENRGFEPQIISDHPRLQDSTYKYPMNSACLRTYPENGDYTKLRYEGTGNRVNLASAIANKFMDTSRLKSDGIVGFTTTIDGKNFNDYLLYREDGESHTLNLLVGNDNSAKWIDDISELLNAGGKLIKLDPNMILDGDESKIPVGDGEILMSHRSGLLDIGTSDDSTNKVTAGVKLKDNKLILTPAAYNPQQSSETSFTSYTYFIYFPPEKRSGDNLEKFFNTYLYPEPYGDKEGQPQPFFTPRTKTPLENDSEYTHEIGGITNGGTTGQGPGSPNVNPKLRLNGVVDSDDYVNFRNKQYSFTEDNMRTAFALSAPEKKPTLTKEYNFGSAVGKGDLNILTDNDPTVQGVKAALEGNLDNLMAVKYTITNPTSENKKWCIFDASSSLDDIFNVGDNGNNNNANYRYIAADYTLGDSNEVRVHRGDEQNGLKGLDPDKSAYLSICSKVSADSTDSSKLRALKPGEKVTVYQYFTMSNQQLSDPEVDGEFRYELTTVRYPDGTEGNVMQDSALLKTVGEEDEDDIDPQSESVSYNVSMCSKGEPVPVVNGDPVGILTTKKSSESSGGSADEGLDCHTADDFASASTEIPSVSIKKDVFYDKAGTEPAYNFTEDNPVAYYKIRVKNHSNKVPATGVYFYDTFDNLLSNKVLTAQQLRGLKVTCEGGDCGEKKVKGTTIEFDNATIPAGGTLVVTIEVKVPQSANKNTDITNNACFNDGTSGAIRQAYAIRSETDTKEGTKICDTAEITVNGTPKVPAPNENLTFGKQSSGLIKDGDDYKVNYSIVVQNNSDFPTDNYAFDDYLYIDDGSETVKPDVFDSVPTITCTLSTDEDCTVPGGAVVLKQSDETEPPGSYLAFNGQGKGRTVPANGQLTFNYSVKLKASDVADEDDRRILNNALTPSGNHLSCPDPEDSEPNIGFVALNEDTQQAVCAVDEVPDDDPFTAKATKFVDESEVKPGETFTYTIQVPRFCIEGFGEEGDDDDEDNAHYCNGTPSINSLESDDDFYDAEEQSSFHYVDDLSEVLKYADVVSITNNTQLLHTSFDKAAKQLIIDGKADFTYDLSIRVTMKVKEGTVAEGRMLVNNLYPEGGTPPTCAESEHTGRNYDEASGQTCTYTKVPGIPKPRSTSPDVTMEKKLVKLNGKEYSDGLPEEHILQPGDTVEYQVIARNDSSDSAPFSLKDDMVDGIDDARVDMTEATCQLTDTNGTTDCRDAGFVVLSGADWLSVAGTGSRGTMMPANSHVTITYTATVTSGGNGMLTNKLIPSDTQQKQCGEAGVTCTSHKVLGYTFDKAIRKKDGDSLVPVTADNPLRLGDQFTYTITVNNTGGTNITDPINLTDYLNDVVLKSDLGLTSGDVTKKLTWDYLGVGHDPAYSATYDGTTGQQKLNLVIGSADKPFTSGGIVMVSFTGTVKTEDNMPQTTSTPEMVNVLATPSRDYPPTDCHDKKLPEGASCVAAPLERVKVVKTETHEDGLDAGKAITYAVTLTNLGQDVDLGRKDGDDYVYYDDLTDVVDDADVKLDTIKISPASAGIAPPTRPDGHNKLVFAPNSILKAGQTVTVTYDVTVKDIKDRVNGNNTVTNWVVSPGNTVKEKCRDNIASCATVKLSGPEFQVDKSVTRLDGDKTVASDEELKAGDTLRYTVKVSNVGDMAGEYTAYDLLDGTLVNADETTINPNKVRVACSSNSSNGTAENADSDGSKYLKLSGSLDSTANCTFTYSVTIKDQKATADNPTFTFDNVVALGTDKPTSHTTCTPDADVDKQIDCTKNVFTPKQPTPPVEKPQFTVVKSVERPDGKVTDAQLDPGDVLTYKVTVTNTDESTEGNFTVNDYLQGVLAHAQGHAIVNGSLDKGTCGSLNSKGAGADQYLEATGTLGATHSCTFQYQVKIAEGLADGVYQFDNVASLTPYDGGTVPQCTPPGDGQTACTSNTVTLPKSPDFKIIKRVTLPAGKISDHDLRAGDELLYEVRVRNFGQATGDFTAVDYLNEVLDKADGNTIVPGSLNKGQCGSASYSDANGNKMITITGNLAPDKYCDISYKVVIADGLEDVDHVLKNTATVNPTPDGSIPACTPPATNDIKTACTQTVFNPTPPPTPATPKFKLTKNVVYPDNKTKASSLMAGDVLTYHVTVSNIGQVGAQYKAFDMVDGVVKNAEGNKIVDGSLTSGTCGHAVYDSAGQFIAVSGHLPQGASCEMSYAVQVAKDLTPGTYPFANVATLTPPTQTTPPASTPACTPPGNGTVGCTVTNVTIPPTPPVKAPRFTLSKSVALPDNVSTDKQLKAGDHLFYTVTVANEGKATGDFTVYDRLDQVLAFAKDNKLDAKPVYASDCDSDLVKEITYQDIPFIKATESLAPGDSCQITYSVTIGKAPAGDTNPRTFHNVAILGGVNKPPTDVNICDHDGVICQDTETVYTPPSGQPGEDKPVPPPDEPGGDKPVPPSDKPGTKTPDKHQAIKLSVTGTHAQALIALALLLTASGAIVIVSARRRES